MRTIVRAAFTAAVAVLLSLPAAAMAADSIPPHVTLQTGPADCELQVVLENFPPGTVTVRFDSDTRGEAVFPGFTFSGEEGGSDRLFTAGPFGSGAWRARVGDAISNTVTLPALCSEEPAPPSTDTPSTTRPASTSTSTSTTFAPAVPPSSQPPKLDRTGETVLPFTGPDRVFPMLTGGMFLLILGALVLWRVRARRRWSRS